MINKKEINLKRAREGVMSLADHGGGFYEELTKLEALGELISRAGEDNAIALQNGTVRDGIYYILRDIAAEIKGGLEYVDKEIIGNLFPIRNLSGDTQE